MKTIKAENYWNKKALKNVKIYMTNKNLTEEEIEILKKQCRFTKCPDYCPEQKNLVS